MARPRYEVLNDGPNRWALVDRHNDDPAPVFETRLAAEVERAKRQIEDGDFEEVVLKS